MFDRSARIGSRCPVPGAYGCLSLADFFENPRHEMLARRTCFAVKQAFQSENAIEQLHFKIALAVSKMLFATAKPGHKRPRRRARTHLPCIFGILAKTANFLVLPGQLCYTGRNRDIKESL
jgi:hypothetical protein